MRAAALSPSFAPGVAGGSGAGPGRRSGLRRGGLGRGGGRLGGGCHDARLGRRRRGRSERRPAGGGELVGAGLQLVEVPAQAVGALAQVDDELRHVTLHLLDALAQPIGRRGDVRDVLARLGLRGLADLLGAALGGLDDRLDLLAGLRGQRRGRRGPAAQVVDRVGDPVEMGGDRGRVVPPAVAGEVVPHDRLAIQGHGPLSLARSRPRPA